MTHNIKITESFADAVLSGDKTFEIRKNDRGYQKGDVVRFETIDRMGLHVPHPVEEREYRISYLVHGWGLKEGWCVFGTEEITDPRRPDRASYPLQIGDRVYFIFQDGDDGGRWKVDKTRVTGIGMKGFRFSGYTDDPESDDCFVDWDAFGRDYFWKLGEAVAEAAKRNKHE